MNDALVTTALQKATDANIHRVRQLIVCYSWAAKHNKPTTAALFEHALEVFVASGDAERAHASLRETTK